MAKHATSTSFVKGKSGNPGGRPKVVRAIQELAREHTEEAVMTLVEALKDPRTKVYAATALLDRGYGRPVQTQNVRVIRDISDLSDDELAAIIGTPDGADEADDTRH